MRGIQLMTQYIKGPQDLKVTDLPDPKPAEDEYVIQVHAAAANFFDILQIQGKYQIQPPFPWTAGFEFAGTILRTPVNPSPTNSTSSTPRFPPGTLVFGAVQGAYATRLTAPEASLQPAPPSWTPSEAAGLFVTAPTAYAGLVQRAAAQRGDWVLVHAGGGGVGLAAVQVAKARGCRVIATAGSARKREVARGFGADFVVDYGAGGWEDEVRGLTPGGRGVDVVFDPVGLVAKSLKCAAWRARIVVVGFAAGTIEKVAMNRVLLKNVSVLGLHWGQYAVQERETVEEVWKAVMGLIERGEFRSTVFTDREFVGLEQVGSALKALGGRETWGKVVVRVGEREGREKL